MFCHLIMKSRCLYVMITRAFIDLLASVELFTNQESSDMVWEYEITEFPARVFLKCLLGKTIRSADANNQVARDVHDLLFEELR